MLQLSGVHILLPVITLTRLKHDVMNDWSRLHSHSGCSSSSKGSPTLMMQLLGWNALEVRKNLARAVMMYRIVNGLTAIQHHCI